MSGKKLPFLVQTDIVGGTVFLFPITFWMSDSHTKIVPLLTITSIAASTTNNHDDILPNFVANHAIYSLQIHWTIMNTISDDNGIVQALPTSTSDNKDNDDNKSNICTQIEQSHAKWMKRTNSKNNKKTVSTKSQESPKRMTWQWGISLRGRDLHICPRWIAVAIQRVNEGQM